MRWADLDSLNHVNNVVYLDYAAESRAMLVDEGVIDDGEAASCISIDFLKPLLLTRESIHVASWRDGDEVMQEIRTAGSDMVFARVVTTLADQHELTVQPGVGRMLPVRIRRSDLDQSGSVSTTKMFELFQESRILFIAGGLSALSPGRFVVGRVEVTFGAPVGWRPEPYAAHSWISRIGDSSVTVESQIVENGAVLAQCRSVLVGFDLGAQSSRPLSHTEKQEFSTLRAH